MKGNWVPKCIFPWKGEERQSQIRMENIFKKSGSVGFDKIIKQIAKLLTAVCNLLLKFMLLPEK